MAAPIAAKCLDDLDIEIQQYQPDASLLKIPKVLKGLAG